MDNFMFLRLLIFGAVLSTVSSENATTLFKRAFPPGRVYNLCTETADIQPLYVDRSRKRMICLAENGIGTVIRGRCKYFDSASNSVQYSDRPVCYFQKRDGLSWREKGVYNAFLEARVQVYVTDSQAPVENHFVCRSKNSIGAWQAGWVRVQSLSDSMENSVCLLPSGKARKKFQVLVFSTQLTSLWNSMEPKDYPDPTGVALSEGLYTLAKTAEECEESCRKVAQCGGIVWYRAHGFCWLKNKSTMDSVPAIVGGSDASFRSKRVSKSSYSPDMGSCRVISDLGKGQIVQGNNLGMGIMDLSGPECCNLCKSRSDCRGVSFLTYEWKCFLHSSVNAPFLAIAGDSVVASV